MREIVQSQLHLVSSGIGHDHSRELEMMSRLLDGMVGATLRVQEDLVRGVRDPKKGRRAMTAEQTLRAVIIKQMNGFSYKELAFHLADSTSYRNFCRFGIADATPKKATLQSNIKRLRPETLGAINQMVVVRAIKEKMEKGDKIRVDCTVTETNIHEPTDSSLLWDCVRVLTRLVKRGQEFVAVPFTNHSRRAKRRFKAIAFDARSMEKRVPLYRDLLKVTNKTVNAAKAMHAALEKTTGHSITVIAKIDAIRWELEHFGQLTARVINQTTRRVLLGESVAAKDKVVSIFEPHTDIIVKDRRDTHYGHKLCVTTDELPSPFILADPHLRRLPTFPPSTGIVALGSCSPIRSYKNSASLKCNGELLTQ